MTIKDTEDATASMREVWAEGQDSSKGITLWESTAPDAPYRLRVQIGDDSARLTLKGARHLQRRLAKVVERLVRKKARK